MIHLTGIQVSRYSAVLVQQLAHQSLTHSTAARHQVGDVVVGQRTYYHDALARSQHHLAVLKYHLVSKVVPKLEEINLVCSI